MNRLHQSHRHKTKIQWKIDFEKQWDCPIYNLIVKEEGAGSDFPGNVSLKWELNENEYIHHACVRVKE